MPFFPLLEEEIGEITEKLQEFMRIIELVKPARFITGALSWCGLGRRLHLFRNTYVLNVATAVPSRVFPKEPAARNTTSICFMKFGTISNYF